MNWLLYLTKKTGFLHKDAQNRHCTRNTVKLCGYCTRRRWLLPVLLCEDLLVVVFLSLQTTLFKSETHSGAYVHLAVIISSFYYQRSRDDFVFIQCFRSLQECLRSHAA